MGQPRISVIHEDNHIIVVNKPPLLPTMGVAAEEPSVVSQVKQFLRDKYAKPGNVYVGVVSRLDAFTSGLLLLTKTSKAAARMTRQFQKGEVKKSYSAILEGRLMESTGQLVDWVAKNDQRRRMEVVSEQSSGAKRAELTWEVLGWQRELTLARIELLTGRKHQIRVQFAHAGTPVMGDRKYGGAAAFSHGIALHSTRLGFVHPVRQEAMDFHVDPPEHWNLQRFTSN
ncbi:MAG: RluA family pseudouridine synthase [Pirellulaceae bacterium]